MNTIYIAHSMTNGKQNLDEIKALITWLWKMKFTIFQPTNSKSPDLLASQAVDAIAKADLVIGDVSVYSHGVGFELGYAFALKKEIIVVANVLAKDRLSKFILGLFPEIIFYQDEMDLISRVSNYLGYANDDNIEHLLSIYTPT